MARVNSKPQKKRRAAAKYCAFCRRPLTDTGEVSGRTIDHFYPMSKGTNLNRSWNKIIICKKCNKDKANDMPVDYVKKLQVKIDELTRIKESLIFYQGKLNQFYEVKDLI